MTKLNRHYGSGSKRVQVKLLFPYKINKRELHVRFSFLIISFCVYCHNYISNPVHTELQIVTLM